MDERPNEPTAASRPEPGSVPPPPPPPPPAPTPGAAGTGQPRGSAADSWAVSAADAEAGGARVRSGRARRTAVILGVVAASVLLVGGIGAAAVLFALRGSPERLSTRTPRAPTTPRAVTW